MPDPAKCLFVIQDAPASMMSRELVLWLFAMRAWDRAWWVNANERDEAMQHNTAIEQALGRPRVGDRILDYDEFVFIEADMRPVVEGLIDFWAAEADVIAATYPNENPRCLAGDGSPMHCGFYWTHRRVLEAIREDDPPCFQWPSNKQRTKTTGCLCHVFARKVLDHGYTIQRAGRVGHRPRK